MTAAAPAGRVVIRARAYEKVFGALLGDELGVPATTPSVRVADDDGRLSASVATVVRLGDAAGGVMAAVERGRARVLADGARLTGAEIGTVRIRVTDVVPDERRVR